MELTAPLAGRALNRLPDTHSAAGNRAARRVLDVAASWERAGGDAANVNWTRDAWRDLRRSSTGGSDVNFLTEEEGEERILAAHGGNGERRSRLRSTYGPQSFFWVNKNIAPRRE